MNTVSISMNGSEAGRLCGAMTAGSLFSALIIDGSEYMQASWVCAALGFLIALPILLTAESNSYKNIRRSRLVFTLISLYMAYKAAAIVRLLINSVSYSNLEIIPTWLIALIMVSACFYIITKNGAGIGNGIKVGALTAIIMIIMIVVGSLKYMNWRWLTPIGGAGVVMNVKGTITAAGNISAAGLIFIAADSRGKNIRRSVKGAAWGTAAAILLCAYSGMIAPLQFTDISDRLVNIERFLSNGRTSLGVQLPITILWFLGYVMALSSYSFASAAFLQKVCPDMSGKTVAFICMAAVYVIAGIGLAESNVLRTVNNFVYVGTVLITAALCIGRSKNEAAF